jgi:hypothetical protein
MKYPSGKYSGDKQWANAVLETSQTPFRKFKPFALRAQPE